LKKSRAFSSISSAKKSRWFHGKRFDIKKNRKEAAAVKTLALADNIEESLALVPGKDLQEKFSHEVERDFMEWEGFAMERSSLLKALRNSKTKSYSLREAGLPPDSRRNGHNNAASLTFPLSGKAKTSIPSV